MKNKTNITTTYSGAGGAHFGFFGRPRMLMNEADGGGGGTGGSAGGSSAAPPPAGDNAGTAPPQESPKLLTQEQVNKIVADRLAEDRARRPGSATPPPAPKPRDDEPLSLAKLKAENEALAMRMSFDKRAAKLGIDDDTADDLFELYKVQRPEDPSAWFEKKSKVFKLTNATSQQTTTTDPTKTATVQPSGPPISDKGSPAPASVDFERSLADNPFGFGGVDKERLIAKHGKEKGTRMWMEAAERKAGSIKVTI